MMMKICWMGLAGFCLLLAGCGSGSSPQETQSKDATADGQTGSTATGDTGKIADGPASLGGDSAVSGPETRSTDLLASAGQDGAQDRDLPGAPPLDASPDSAAVDAARETLNLDGPGADGVADARVPDLGPGAEAGTVKADSADNRADSSSVSQDFPCRDDSDCCIVIDGCKNVAYLYSTAPGAAPEPTIPPPNDWCTGCIPPAIQVRCVARQCVGERISSSYSGPLLSSHCGPVKLPDAGASGYHDIPADASAPTPKSVWTCGGG